MRVVPLRSPDLHVITLLESLLRQAKAGELVSLIYSAEVAGNRVQSGYTPIENLYTVIGQLERMKGLLLRNIDDTAQEMDQPE